RGGVAVHLAPGQERADESRPAPGRVPRLRRRKHQRGVRPHLLGRQFADGPEARLARPDLDDEVRADPRQLQPLADDRLPVRQVRVDLDADRLVRAGAQRRDLVEHAAERLAGTLDVPRVGRQPVDVPHVQGVTDLVGVGAVEKHLHDEGSPLSSFRYRFRNSTGSPWFCRPSGPLAGVFGSGAWSVTRSPVSTTLARSPRSVMAKRFHSPNRASARFAGTQARRTSIGSVASLCRALMSPEPIGWLQMLTW